MREHITELDGRWGLGVGGGRGLTAKRKDRIGTVKDTVKSTTIPIIRLMINATSE